MEELYRVGERVAQENAAVGNPQAFAEALGGDPALAELLGGGGDIEEYLQSYEQMLQEGLSGGGGVQLNQVDHEGGITVRPEPGFVIKTRDTASGMKVFLNIVSNEHVEAPHMKSFAELEGEEGCRVPLSVGTPQEDFDKKSEPCVTYDLVANPTVVEECQKEPAFRDSVIQLCLAAIAQKYKVELDVRYKLPKMKYKGSTVQLQRIRKQRQSQIQEVSGSGGAGPAALGKASGEVAQEDGPQQPDFCVYYSWEGAEAIDGFAEQWGPPPDDAQDVADSAHILGFDLPIYRANEFLERIRGTMKNKAERQGKEEKPEESVGRPGEKETREMLVGRTCVVQVRMSALDRQLPSLKQFRVDVSDECLRINFPLLPRSGRTAYAPLTLWWPQHFCSAQARAEWDTKSDTLTVMLPTEAPAEVAAFDPALLDAVF